MQRGSANIFQIGLLSLFFALLFSPSVAAEDDQYTLSLSTSTPNLNLSIDTVPEGVVDITHHEITATTNAPQGLEVIIEAAAPTLNNASNPSKIQPTLSTFSTPSPLPANSWGIAVSLGTSTLSANFSPNDSYLNKSPTSLFASPASPTPIYRGPSKTFSVYYGTNITDLVPSGTYSQTITYTVHVAPPPLTTPSNMQDFNQSHCEQLTEDTSYSIRDTRDNQLYTIARLKDGKCWMTQNLRLKLDSSTTLTPNNTNIPSNWTPPHSTEISVPSDPNTNTPWVNDPQGYDTVRSIYQESTYHKYGVYYSHSAATAGFQQLSQYNPDKTHISTSICPKGWHLPATNGRDRAFETRRFVDPYRGSINWTSINSSQNQYDNFTLLRGQNNFGNSPISLKLSGRYNSNSIFSEIGNIGAWWSSTTTNRNDSAYIFTRSKNQFHAEIPSARNDGLAIRCVLDQPYIQDFTPQNCAALNNSTPKILIDKRDDEKYVVAKLKDNKCWMTQNLRLKLNTSITLTPKTTSLLSDWNPIRSTENSPGTVWSNDPEGAKTSRSVYHPYYPDRGVYYTHSSATAQYSNRLNLDGDDSVESICPKGWTLPKASTDYQPDSLKRNNFFTLGAHYTNNPWNHSTGAYNGLHTLSSGLPSFSLNGYYGFGSGYFTGLNSLGFWWTSTVKSATEAYSTKIDDNSIDPIDDNSRLYGFPIRCVQYNPSSVYELSTMQEFTPDICQKMPPNTRFTLLDNRDSQRYAIQKLADGHCWMAENLRLKLDSNTALTPDNTDLASNWTPQNSTIVTNKVILNDWETNHPDEDHSIHLGANNLVYYNFPAATAGSFLSATQNAPHSICPKGWTLPSSGERYDSTDSIFWRLANAYRGSATWQSDQHSGWFQGQHLLMHPSGANFDTPGFFGDYGFFGIGQNSNWWSSTISSDEYEGTARVLHVYEDIIRPNAAMSTYIGLPIRCIAR